MPVFVTLLFVLFSLSSVRANNQEVSSQPVESNSISFSYEVARLWIVTLAVRTRVTIETKRRIGKSLKLAFCMGKLRLSQGKLLTFP